MKDEYVLYLDESELKRSKTFAIAGIAIKKDKVEFLEREMNEVKKLDATVFSCIIKMQQLQELFFLSENHNGIHLIDDKYNIALQKIIESFTHYLALK